MNLGENIKNVRLSRGKTQQDLAEDVGISQAMVNGIERGVKRPSVPVLAAIAESLNVSVDSLIATA